jgi:hypothetical protein
MFRKSKNENVLYIISQVCSLNNIEVITAMQMPCVNKIIKCALSKINNYAKSNEILEK